jgi:hypothetical protein
MYTCKYVTHPLHWNVGEISDCNFNLGEISNGTTPKIRKSQTLHQFCVLPRIWKENKKEFFNIKKKT